MAGGVYAVVLKRVKNDDVEAIKINMEDHPGYQGLSEYDSMIVASRHPYGCKIKGWILEGIRPETEVGHRTIYSISNGVGENGEEISGVEGKHISYPIARCPIYSPLTSNLPFAIKKLIFAQILTFLEYYHRCGFIHGDIKEDNILVDTSRKETRVRVIDFGLARRLSDECVYHGIIAPMYRPPEVYEKKKYNFTVDIWSVACMMIILFTGKAFISPAEEAETPSEIREKAQDTMRRRNIQVLFDSRTRALMRGNGNFHNLCDLLAEMLNPNHLKRYTASQCLEHRFFEDIYEKKIHPIRTKRIKIPSPVESCDHVPKRPKGYSESEDPRVYDCFKRMYGIAMKYADNLQDASNVAWAIACKVYDGNCVDDLENSIWNTPLLIETARAVISKGHLFGCLKLESDVSDSPKSEHDGPEA